MKRTIEISPSKSVRTLKFSFDWVYNSEVIIENIISDEKFILLSGDVSNKRFLLITEIAGNKRVFYGPAEALFEYHLKDFSKTSNGTGIKIAFQLTEDDSFIYADTKEDISYGNKYYCPELWNVHDDKPYCKMIRYITP